MTNGVYCRGKKLDASPEKFGEMRDSSGLIGDAGALRARMASDGYLLFRGLVGREKVLAARREILLKYAIIGEIDSINHDVMDAIMQKDTFIDEVNMAAFTESVRSGKAYQDLTVDPGIIDYYETFLGGKARTFNFKLADHKFPGRRHPVLRRQAGARLAG